MPQHELRRDVMKPKLIAHRPDIGKFKSGAFRTSDSGRNPALRKLC